MPGQHAAITWQDLDPGGWLTTTPISIHVQVTIPTGLNPAGSSYAFSTDNQLTWSNWLTASLQVASPLTTTALLTVTDLALPDGTGNWIRFRVQDSSGGNAVSPPYHRFLDTQAPQVAITWPQAGGIYTNVVAVQGQAGDATSGVNCVQIELQNDQSRFWNGHGWQNAPAWWAANGLSNWQVANLPSWQGEKIYTATAKACDVAGWQENSEPVTFTVDQVPPTAPVELAVSPVDWSRQNIFTVTWQNPVDVSGIAGAWYRWQTPPTAPDDGIYATGENISSISLAAPGEGDIPLYVWLQDGVGQIGWRNWALVHVRYDNTPPGAPVALHASPAGWQNVNHFSLRWQNPIDLSGIGGAWYKLNGEPTSANDGTFVSGAGLQQISDLQMPGDGVFDVYLWLVDGAGNSDPQTRNVKQAAFSFDSTAPQVHWAFTGTLGNNGWYTDAVQATLSAEDAASGVGQRFIRLNNGAWQQTDQLSCSHDGTYTLAGKAKDVAGNTSAVVTGTVNVDSTPPTLQLHYSIAPHSNDWFYEPVTVTATATDATSGAGDLLYSVDNGSWQCGDAVTFSQEGQHSLRFRSVDRAGNRREVGPLAINVDLQPPVTTYLVDGVPGNDPWYRSNVTVTLVAEDAGSGVQDTLYKIDNHPWQHGVTFTLTSDGLHTVWFYSVDNAGRRESSYPTPIWIDNTAPPAPTVLFVTPSGWTNNNVFTVTWGTPADLSSVVGAYYKVGEAPTANGDGIYYAGGHRTGGISVPGEGIYDLYLWLQDGAGNADYRNYLRAAQILHFDQTQPHSTVTLSPPLEAQKEWYRTPVTATFAATDTLSGLDHIEYAVDTGPWQRGAQAIVRGNGKHVLFYRAVDVAGNVESANHVTLRIDTTPPLLTAAQISPQGWTTQGQYTITWQSPLDDSGVVGLWYKIGAAPVAPGDGNFIAGDGRVTLSTSLQGKYDLYLWLEDHAGNASFQQALRLPAAIWHDGTPPQIRVNLAGPRGENNWFTGPITVDISADDAVSGVDTLWVQIDGNTPLTQTHFIWREEGKHNLKVWATDIAGNKQVHEPTYLQIDSYPPIAFLRPLPAYTTEYRPIFGDNVLFHVSWGGVDPLPGSGIASYDVQARDGWSGNWLIWQMNTTETGGDYFGQLGHTYFFRVRGRDKSGHVQPFSDDPNGDGYTNLQLVVDGGFETGTFRFWSGNEDGLKRTVRPALSYLGENSLVAYLGDPDEYGTNEHPGKVPIGAAKIWQVIKVPPQNQMKSPYLSLWYHMITWDVRYAYSHHRWQDTFEVHILTPTGKELAMPLVDGYRGHNPPVAGVDYGVEHDLGWKRFTYNLEPYAGQMIMIELANWNRWDNLYNTWTLVDNVRVEDDQVNHHVYFPGIWAEEQTAILTPHTTSQPTVPAIAPSGQAER